MKTYCLKLASLAGVIAACCWISAMTARGEQPTRTDSAAAKPHELATTDLEAFLDGLLPYQIERDDIAGAVVAVVKDGKLLFAKGYGFADSEKRVPVSPEDTLFRPGSISKLFTWTAVMQLVEQGKLDLDRDVNDYLDLRIAATYPEPITLRHLMTHRPGFEESVKELFVRDAGALRPLVTVLAGRQPQRIFPPETTPAYSNYGAGFAGYVVQRVSGKPFEAYVDEFIFKPLGMTHSTFAQPLLEWLRPLMSKGYMLASQGAKPFELVEPAPAGSLSASAAELAQFMLAHLQDGQLAGRRILRPDTARLMHSRQVGLHPALNAMALGFYEESRNGHRIIGHGGDTIYFHSDLHLILDSGVGFFVSYNSSGRGDTSPRGALFQRFLDRYFPYTPPPAHPLPSEAADARAVSGGYVASRRSQTNIAAVSSLFGELTVTPNPDHTITVAPIRGLNGQLIRWQEIGPMVYRQTHGQARLAFQRDRAGRLELVPDWPAIVFERASWSWDRRFNLAILLNSIAVFVLTLALWPVASLVRRHYGRRLELSPGARRLRLAVRGICATDLLFLLLGAGLMFPAFRDLTLLGPRLDPWIHLWQLVGIFAVLGTLVAFYDCLRSWSHRSRWVWSKVHDTVIALACLGFGWFVLNWHLLNFRLRY